jgi:hypothetical protein
LEEKCKMSLDLSDFEQQARRATKAFWSNRSSAAQKQAKSGRADQGERSGVTAGKNMDGFVALIISLVKVNGLETADIHQTKGLLTLPGFFRPTKLWDLIVMHQGRLIAAIELKSHVGPSFGNNFNNRAEEAVGMGHDFWTAYRDEAFGAISRPFTGWMIMVEDGPASRRPVKDQTPHYPILPEFENASYLARYDILCRKLIQEQLYSAAALITSEREAETTGHFGTLSPTSSLRSFIAAFAGHIAAEAARSD